jgi:hypothetical protein
LASATEVELNWTTHMVKFREIKAGGIQYGCEEDNRKANDKGYDWISLSWLLGCCGHERR